MLQRIPLFENAIAAGATSAEFSHTWGRDGVVIAVAIGTTSGLLVDRAGIALAIYRRRSDVVKDDFGREFLPGCVTGAADPAYVDWSTLLLPVKCGEIWTLQWRNEGPNQVTPQIIFDVVSIGDETRLRAA